MVNRYQRMASDDYVDESVQDPYLLVMIGDLTVFSEYAKEHDVSITRLRKLSERRREGSLGRRLPHLNAFPAPVKTFPYFDVYLTSELDEWFELDQEAREAKRKAKGT